MLKFVYYSFFSFVLLPTMSLAGLLQKGGCENAVLEVLAAPQILNIGSEIQVRLINYNPQTPDQIKTPLDYENQPQLKFWYLGEVFTYGLGEEVFHLFIDEQGAIHHINDTLIANHNIEIQATEKTPQNVVQKRGDCAGFSLFHCLAYLRTNNYLPQNSWMNSDSWKSILEVAMKTGSAVSHAEDALMAASGGLSSMRQAGAQLKSINQIKSIEGYLNKEGLTTASTRDAITATDHLQVGPVLATLVLSPLAGTDRQQLPLVSGDGAKRKVSIFYYPKFSSQQDYIEQLNRIKERLNSSLYRWRKKVEVLIRTLGRAPEIFKKVNQFTSDSDKAQIFLDESNRIQRVTYGFPEDGLHAVLLLKKIEEGPFKDYIVVMDSNFPIPYVISLDTLKVAGINFTLVSIED